jgi:hypothetical protein
MSRHLSDEDIGRVTGDFFAQLMGRGLVHSRNMGTNGGRVAISKTTHETPWEESTEQTAELASAWNVTIEGEGSVGRLKKTGNAGGGKLEISGTVLYLQNKVVVGV